MEDSTQELVQSYLRKNDFDVDLLRDPLDTDSLPPASSPLKKHFDKLRGSPVKGPGKAKINYANYALYFENDASFVDSDEDSVKESLFDAVSPFRDFSDIRDIESVPTHRLPASTFFPESTEYEKYRVLLASSTEKLLAQLAAERDRSRQLQAELEAAKSQNGQAEADRSENAVLRAENRAMQQKMTDLERRYSDLKYHSNEARLVKENALLRQKLAKYKRLYDSVKNEVYREPYDAAMEQVHASTERKEAQRDIADSITEEQRAEDDYVKEKLLEKDIFPSEYTVQMQTMATFVKAIGDEIKQINATLAKNPRKNVCSACTSVESSRPNSQSTRDENTQKLMGKYPWNTTV